ncbi:hypothetical protein A3731_00700 [Roseovarius sp. HI0049]|nr:hypothetical protein A3731_00700 [Roseovarius sp. HI0049]
MGTNITHRPNGGGGGLAPSAILHPALSPWKAIRTVAHCEAAKAIMPTTYDRACVLPVMPDEVATLLRDLPDLPALKAARQEIVAALEAKADQVQIAQIAGAVVNLKTTAGANGKSDKIEALAFMLGFEAEVEPVSPFVLAAAMYELAKASPFVPDPSEVLKKIPTTRSTFEQSVRRVDLLIDAREQLEEDAEFDRRKAAGEFDDILEAFGGSEQ